MSRDDLFTMIHKVLRKGLFDTCMLAGATDYDDPSAVERLRDAWQRCDMMLRGHSDHEHNIIQAPLEALSPGATVAFDAEHDQIHRMLDELNTQSAALAEEADAAGRARRGLEFYRAINRLVGAALPHFDAEETQLMPRMWALMSDDEIAVVRGTLMKTLTPAELAYVGDYADGALDSDELEQLRARAKPPAMAGVS